MSSISKAYIRSCMPKYSPLGFTRNKLTCARIQGEVIQAFTFRQLQYPRVCTVEFGIFPLCLPVPVYLEAGGYELDRFDVERRASSSGWRCDPQSDESIADCVASISQAIDRYLLPLFEECHDCKSSLAGLIRLEELFESNRLKSLHIMGASDCAAPWQDRCWFDARKYYMALKAHDYSYAQEYLSYQVAFCKRKLDSFQKANSPEQPERVKKRFAEKLVKLEECLERMESGDAAYFDELIRQNECKMLEYLAVKYPKILPATKSLC